MTTKKLGTVTRPPKPGTRIEVIWQDCFTFDAWADVETLLAKKLPAISTTGYYIGRTGESTWVLASGLSVQGDELHGGASWFIPEAVIVSWVSTENTSAK